MCDLNVEIFCDYKLTKMSSNALNNLAVENKKGLLVDIYIISDK